MRTSLQFSNEWYSYNYRISIQCFCLINQPAGLHRDNMLICNAQLKIAIRYIATVSYNHSNNSNISLVYANSSYNISAMLLVS